MSTDSIYPKIRFPEFRDLESWSTIKLEDCLLQAPDYGLNAPAVPYSDKLPTYLRITDIADDGTFISENKMSVNAELNENNSLHDGDIVFARTGASVGKAYKYRTKDGALIFAGFLIRIRPNQQILRSEYIYQYLFTSSYKNWVQITSTRSGQPGINSKEYSSLLVPHTSPTEQQKIADCLSSLDKYIDATKRKLELLKEYKNGLMQYLFPTKGKTVPELRFPEFQNDGEWGWKKLGEFLYEHKTKSDGKCEVHSVSVSKGVINQKMYLGRSFAASDTSNYKLVKPNDVIYTKSPTGNFPFGIVKQSFLDYNVIVSPLYAVYSPTNRYVGYLIQAYFESPIRLNNYLYPIVKKGAKNTIQITNEEFLSREICLPSNENEQQKIADCLSSLDNAIAALENKTFELEIHKKGLLQQIFPNNII